MVHRMAKRSNFYHGMDGFGDAGLEPIEPKIEHEHAVHALIRLAHEYEGTNPKIYYKSNNNHLTNIR
jgi:inosine-uridine nucleoside N-ribohydrolase